MAVSASVQRAKASLDRDGAAVLRGLLTPDDLAELASLLAPLFARYDALAAGGRCRVKDTGALLTGEPPGRSQPEIERPSLAAPALRRCRAYRRLREAASGLLGGQARYVFDQALVKAPRMPVPTPWHQDQAYLSGAIRLHTVNFWVPLQATDRAGGALMFVPGSHARGLMAHRAAHGPRTLALDRPRDETIYAPDFAAGDVSVHDPFTVHGAGGNARSVPRMAYAVHFSLRGRLGYLQAGLARRAVHRIVRGRLA